MLQSNYRRIVFSLALMLLIGRKKVGAQATCQDGEQNEDETGVDCGGERCEACEAIDCVWGEYGEWSTCSATCGGGTRTRTRPEATPASDGGAACTGSATESGSCNPNACPENPTCGATISCPAGEICTNPDTAQATCTGKASAATAAAAAAAVAAIAASSPPPMNMFPPQGAPQPGSLAAGGGVTTAAATAVAGVTAEVSLLTLGINGAIVLAVFSSAIPGSFLLPRAVPATATIFAEPDDAIPRTSISRQDSGSHDASCRRPILRLGPFVNYVTNPEYPLVVKLRKQFERVQQRVSAEKIRIYDSLNIACLFPRLIHPFEPILSYTRCKLGLDDDGFMEAAKCDEMRCERSEVEEKTITRDIGPVPMKMMNLRVESMSDCFEEMREIKYGARILAKIVDDKSCSDPQYAQECEELMSQGRVVDEDQCSTPDCNGKEDDIYRPCFDCEGFTARQVYGDNFDDAIEFHWVDRQTAEQFQATRQSRRLLCRQGANGEPICKLRVNRAMQLRNESYRRILEFVHAEQYLSQEDIDILFRYLNRV